VSRWETCMKCGTGIRRNSASVQRNRHLMRCYWGSDYDASLAALKEKLLACNERAAGEQP
jgi:hypothetical protein